LVAIDFEPKNGQIRIGLRFKSGDFLLKSYEPKNGQIRIGLRFKSGDFVVPKLVTKSFNVTFEQKITRFEPEPRIIW